MMSFMVRRRFYLRRTRRAKDGADEPALRGAALLQTR
jgi:hypothetical protein